MQKAWHRLEAEALTIEWNESKDPWHAVNASAHWRKAHEPLRALDVTEAALCMIGQNEKHQSALFTTRGGALRDIGRLNDAKTFGLKAHELTPTDFRPCTLLGAVSMELGDIKNGHIWYLKAETLGAKRTAIDVEIRTLLIRSSKGMRDSITTYLLTQDPERFAWLRKWRVR